MTNLEKFKQEILDGLNSNDLYYTLLDVFMEHNSIYPETGKDLINWLSEDYKEPILTPMEKSYLLNIINPIKDRVHWVKLHGRDKTPHIEKDDSSKLDWVEIKYDELHDNCKQIVKLSASLCLPSFEHKTQFRGMKYNHKYALDELDL